MTISERNEAILPTVKLFLAHLIDAEGGFAEFAAEFMRTRNPEDYPDSDAYYGFDDDVMDLPQADILELMQTWMREGQWGLKVLNPQVKVTHYTKDEHGNPIFINEPVYVRQRKNWG